MKNIKVDFVTNTIIVTKGFYELAMDYTSDEHGYLQEVRAAHPKMKVSVREVHRRSRQNDSKGLTYRYMRKFISIMDEKNLATFEKTILYYEGLYVENAKVYQYVKEWFLENYPEHTDMIIGTAPKKVA